MAQYTGIQKPTNKIVASAARPPMIQELKVEAATNMYPGRLVKPGTNNDDMVVGDASKAIGWLGFEDTAPAYRPSTVDTIQVINDQAAMLNGGGFNPVGSLATPCVVTRGDPLANWAAGQLIGPAYPAVGGIVLEIPFTNSAASVADTGIDLPADVMIKDAWIDVTTEIAASTIDVGFINAGEGGDEDGLIDGLACTAAGKIRPGVTVTTGSSETYLSANTRGVLLSDFLVGTDAGSDFGVYAEKPYATDGTIKSLTYTTNNKAVVGNIYLELAYPGLEIVAKAEEDMDASSAAKDIIVRSLI